MEPGSFPWWLRTGLAACVWLPYMKGTTLCMALSLARVTACPGQKVLETTGQWMVQKVSQQWEVKQKEKRCVQLVGTAP